MEYSTFHSLNVDHPSWKERMACLDTEQSTLWKAMSSFESGVILLTVEQFGPAEQCFRKVTKEFPSCFEAWTNRGYALLMQYCDNLEADDLKGFDVGQIVCGGFYRRPGSLPTVRGRDPEVWWEAVGSLREAMRLNPDSTLTKANLGLAYLVAPEGKDVAKAARFLQEAVEMVEKDSSLDPVARAAVYINAGVAGFAEGKGVSCATLLGKAEEQIALYAKQQRRPPESVGVSAALLYNKALLRAAGSADEKKAAAADMARYLTSTSPSSVCWPVAYSHYVELCRQQGLAPKGESDLKAARQPLRPIIGVELAKGVTVALTDKVEELDRLGQSEVVRVIGNLRRLRYLSYGTELLVSGQVLAICLKGSQAPPLPVRAGGLGGKTSLLKVGMAQQELEEVLGNEDYDFRQLDDPQVHYRFYRSLGIAVRVKQKVVQELVVVQIPERSM